MLSKHYRTFRSVARTLLPLMMVFVVVISIPASLSKPEAGFYVPVAESMPARLDGEGHYYYAQTDDVSAILEIVKEHGGEVWYKPGTNKCTETGLPSLPYVVVRVPENIDMSEYGMKPGIKFGLCAETVIHYRLSG